MDIKKTYRFARRYYKQFSDSKNSRIKLFNYSFGETTNYLVSLPYNRHWLYRFIEHRNYLEGQTGTLSIFSVHGDRFAIKINRSKYKIFYTLENVHAKESPWIIYEDMLVNDKQIDLSLGFDFLVHDQYIRFPYWLMTIFEPTDNYEDIKRKCDDINKKRKSPIIKNKFCSFICRNDYFGDRKYFLDLLNGIESVKCPGSFMHNDESLRIHYNDNKREYLKEFKFNLCPENTNNEGYVTEKIFDSILANCIPVYWGSNNNPEPDILNQNRIIFLELNSDNTQALEQIRSIWEVEMIYEKYILQPIFLLNAADVIYEYFDKLDRRLKEIIQ